MMKRKLEPRELTIEELASVRGGDFGGGFGAAYGDFGSLPTNLDFSRMDPSAFSASTINFFGANPGALAGMPQNIQDFVHGTLAPPAPPAPPVEIAPVIDLAPPPLPDHLPAALDLPPAVDPHPVLQGGPHLAPDVGAHGFEETAAAPPGTDLGPAPAASAPPPGLPLWDSASPLPTADPMAAPTNPGAHEGAGVAATPLIDLPPDLVVSEHSPDEHVPDVVLHPPATPGEDPQTIMAPLEHVEVRADAPGAHLPAGQPLGGIALGERPVDPVPAPYLGPSVQSDILQHYEDLASPARLVQGGNNAQALDGANNCWNIAVINAVHAADATYLGSLVSDAGNGFSRIQLTGPTGPTEVLVREGSFYDPEYATASGPQNLVDFEAAFGVLHSPDLVDPNQSLLLQSAAARPGFPSDAMSSLGLEPGATWDYGNGHVVRSYTISPDEVAHDYVASGGAVLGNVFVVGTFGEESTQAPLVKAYGLSLGHAYQVGGVTDDGQVTLLDPRAGRFVDDGGQPHYVTNPAPVPIERMSDVFGTAFHGTIPGRTNR